jgi:tetratricopeptide (TPR) repeat protein
MRYRAKALASQGHLPQALEEYSQSENQPGCPSWLYKAFVAGLYDNAKQHDKGLEWTWMAVRENPVSSLQLDLANRLLRYKRDTVKAREVIAIAEKSTMNEVAKPFYLRCLGILAYLEGDIATARKELEASLAIMLNTAQQPYRDGNISVARGYLCCVLARQGDMPAARKCFDQAKPYLVATGEDELLAECQNALGVI